MPHVCNSPSESSYDLKLHQYHQRRQFQNRAPKILNQIVFTTNLETPAQIAKRRTRRKTCSPICIYVSTICCLLIAIAIAAFLVAILVSTQSTEKVSTSTAGSTILTTNLVTNGDGETGSCATGSGITSPTGWNFNGSITQIFYNNTSNFGHSPSIPGPSDRGDCYFYGQASSSTTMWQTINLTNYVSAQLIDSQTVRFNLSAWLGSYGNQDDNAMVTLTFTDQLNQIIGSQASVGPVLANDRANQTSLIFRQNNGVVPSSTRFLTVVVTITRVQGPMDNGDADNYAIELLHTRGEKFDNLYLNDESLRNIMIALAKKNDRCFYELAKHAYLQLKKDQVIDLKTIFNDEEFDDMCEWLENSAKQSRKVKSYQVATVHVNASSTCIMPLESTEGHRVLRHRDFNDIQDFCLVYLKRKPPAKYIKNCDHFKQVFQSGIEICNHRYYLFGASSSQMREHNFWFLRSTSMEEVHRKRQQLVSFENINNIGKYIARLGQWFSKSKPTEIKLTYVADVQEFNLRVAQGDKCVTQVDDIEIGEYCFTDGSGLISKGLAKLIAQKLNSELKEDEHYPSAYQIRMAGCKGVVIIEPDSNLNQFYIKIRPSMKKFECNDWTLEICEASQAVPTRLNNQIIIIMSELGVPDSVFFELQEKWFVDKSQAQRSEVAHFKNKLPLPTNECRYMFGCTLESKLKAGQCFIQYELLQDDGQKLENRTFKTVVGPVVITKNPCPYAGDMLKLEAVDIPELHCLKDVVVFSTNDDRPDPNKIAGSDLDGDHYFVYWGQQLQISEMVTPLEYKNQVSNTQRPTFTCTEFIDYCLSLLGSTSYGEIYNLHATVVDKNKENHPKPTCQPLAITLAKMFSVAIDANKTGNQIDPMLMTDIRKIVGGTCPNFIKAGGYQSQSIVGRLFRKAAEFRNENPQLFEDQEVSSSNDSPAKTSERNLRFYVRVRTALNIAPHDIYEELRSAPKIKVPSRTIIKKWCDYYKTKNPLEIQMVDLPTNTNVEDAEENSSD